MRFDPFVEVTVDPTKPIRKVFAREFSDFQSSIGSKLAIDVDAVWRRTENARIRFAAQFGLLTLADLAELERRKAKFARFAG